MSEIDDLDFEVIPFNIPPSKFYSITLKGWNNFSFDITDTTFSEFSQLVHDMIASFISIYKDTHTFTQPEIILKPNDELIEIKIGTLKKKEKDE